MGMLGIVRCKDGMIGFRIPAASMSSSSCAVKWSVIECFLPSARIASRRKSRLFSDFVRVGSSFLSCTSTPAATYKQKPVHELNWEALVDGGFKRSYYILTNLTSK